MKVTVAICTWNRAKLLDQTLRAMRALSTPPGVDWELLIVNNHCTDDTEQVVESHSRHLPIRMLLEPSPGQSHARNRAVAGACGELIVWTDDDVLVDRHWLSEHVRAARACPEAAFFGGPIEPWFEGEPPPWIEAVWPIIANAFATRRFAPDPVLLDPGHLPFGANYAVRTAAQRKYEYDPSFGLRPGGSLRGDETAMFLRMLQDGHRGRWVPGAMVRHHIPKSRQTIRYLRSYYRGWGEYLAMTEDYGGHRKWFGRPRWAWRGAVESEARYAFHRLFADPQLWIGDLIRASTCQGVLRGSRKGRSP